MAVIRVNYPPPRPPWPFVCHVFPLLPLFFRSFEIEKKTCSVCCFTSVPSQFVVSCFFFPAQKQNYQRQPCRTFFKKHGKQKKRTSRFFPFPFFLFPEASNSRTFNSITSFTETQGCDKNKRIDQWKTIGSFFICFCFSAEWFHWKRKRVWKSVPLVFCFASVVIFVLFSAEWSHWKKGKTKFLFRCFSIWRQCFHSFDLFRQNGFTEKVMNEQENFAWRVPREEIIKWGKQTKWKTNNKISCVL